MTTLNNNDNKQWQLNAVTEALGDLQINITDKLSVGRGQDNDLVLGSKQISRQHAELTVVDNELLVQDLGSSNGTLVNDVKLEPHQPTAVKEEDVVTFATLSFKIKQAAQAQSAATLAEEPKEEGREPVSEQSAAQHAEENAEVVEKADIEGMSKAELDKKLEQELEEPIAMGDPDQKLPVGNTEEYYEELAAEADPEVHRSKQAASAQMSATAEIHEQTAEVTEEQPQATDNKPVAKEAPVTNDNLQKTATGDKNSSVDTTTKVTAEPKPAQPKPSFNTVKEPQEHKVAHVNNSAPQPTSNKAKTGKSNSFLWLALILVGLAVVLWLYNSGSLV